MELKSSLLDKCCKTHFCNNLRIYFTIFMLCAFVTSSSGTPTRKEFRTMLQNCQSVVRFKCLYLSKYCRVRTLFKRDIESLPDFSADDHHSNAKLSTRLISRKARFRVSCKVCRTYCW
ncbi:uncharacterized protein LOC143465344 [Clavelina lepadiformis]|uniref:Secreted protein n=1 Tax=Clavelina lepadiformis TaxID=159417 RepID=A0ABP0EYJ9_CLALP